MNTPDTVPAPAIIRAAFWMVGSLASFIALAIAVRELARDMGIFEILFFRSLIGVALMTPLVIRYRSLRSQRLGLQLTRNSVHFIGQYLWAFAVTLLPLADVFALEFTTPVWVTLLAMLVLREHLTPPRMIAIAGGFLGVLIILRPGLTVFDPRSLLVLAAAVSFACSVVMVKILTRHDSPLTIIFYMALIQMPMALIPALFNWVTPEWAHLPWLIVAGITGFSAHFTMAQALKIADASVIQPIDFLRLPLVALLGYIFYDEALDAWVLGGAAVIFCANYYVLRQESRR
ncbi:MAG: DMT family transporter [Gammaproteobacteria bacterium]